MSLRTAAGVLLLVALAMAPLNFGSTRRVPLEMLVTLTAAAGALWLTGALVRRPITSPPFSLQLGAGLVGLSGVAWWFWLQQPPLPDFTREHFARISERWPHSVVPRDLRLTTLWAVVAVVALFALVDFARAPEWRAAIATVMLLTGVAVAVLGLLQNASAARGIYWETDHRMPGAFFGPFFHHTAAGAYLNSVWPVGLGLALAWLKRSGQTPNLRWLACGALAAVAVILAAHAGHISRFPQAIAVVTLLVFAVWAGVWRMLGVVRGLRTAVCALGVILLVGIVSLDATRFGTIASRWQQLAFSRSTATPALPAAPVAAWPKLMRDDLFIPSDHGNYLLGDRGAMYATAAAAIADRPWFGWGPGGWMAAAAAHSVDPFVRTFYLTIQFAHSDLLQTCVEWGLIGAAGWLLLVPAAVVNGLTQLRTHPSLDYIGAGATAALTAVLVQSLIDFPLEIPAVQLNAVALAALAWTVPPAGSTIPFSVNFS